MLLGTEQASHLFPSNVGGILISEEHYKYLYATPHILLANRFNLKFVTALACLMYMNKREQAGAELCQALVQVDLVAVFILQLNFRFGKHWKSEFSHV